MTTLQRVVSDLVVKPIWPLCKLIVTSQAYFGISMNRYATATRLTRLALTDSDRTTGEHPHFCHLSRIPREQMSYLLELPYINTVACSPSLLYDYYRQWVTEGSYRVPRPLSPYWFCISGHCSICLHDITPKLRSAYTTTQIIPMAKYTTFQIPLSGVGCWYRMRDPRYLRMAFGIFPELEKRTGMLMFYLTSWQIGVPL